MNPALASHWLNRWSSLPLDGAPVRFSARHACVSELPRWVCSRGPCCRPCGCSRCWGGVAEDPSSSSFPFRGITCRPVVTENTLPPWVDVAMACSKTSSLSSVCRCGAAGCHPACGHVPPTFRTMFPPSGRIHATMVNNLPQNLPGGVRSVARVNSRNARRWPVFMDGVVSSRLSGAKGLRSRGNRRHDSGGSRAAGRVDSTKDAGGSGSCGPGSPVVATLRFFRLRAGD
jgi:hypothetical protein